MKKIFSIIVILTMIFPYFAPLTTVFAQTENYVVASVKSNGTMTDIGTYNDFNSAKQAMNNYKSTIDDVAVIKRSGKIVYAKYGVYRVTSGTTITTFDTDYGSRYISPDYNTDMLFLDYDPNTNKVKVMISGATGWISLDKGSIYPFSYITSGTVLDTSKKYVKIVQGGIRLREGAGTDYKQIGCNGGLTCSEGVSASAGSIYEWLNYGSVTTNGGYEWYKVNINGNIGYIANDPSNIYLTEYNPVIGNKQDFKTYYYVNNNGELYHSYYISKYNSVWTTRLGKAPLYLNKGTTYYSFDGNYFYNDFTKLVNDMRSNTYNNAVNKMPYYNYYQYLPTRTQTHYNADNLNSYIGYDSKIDRSKYYELKQDSVTGKYKWTATSGWDDFPSNQSMLYNEGETFIKSQEIYGVNAATTLALAITESGWGRSYMSVREYNIFGHGAFDTAPDEYAASYESVAAGIFAHAFKYIALDYSNPTGGAHYNGSHYGNKLSGNNVSYASDAYWGEKMAGNYYSLDKTYGFQDYNQRLTFGIKQQAAAAPVYSEPKTNSTKYYNLKAIPNIPVTILEEVTGESINGNNIWYKIQSDVPIDENRNLVNLNDGKYNFETSYAYIHSSYIYKESKEPVITASNITISSGSKLDALKGVTAYDAFDGDLTSKITIKSNNVNTNKVGVYSLVYSATDSEGYTGTKEIKVTVLESAPSIFVSDKETVLGEEIDLMKDVTATDFEDGDLTTKISIKENNLNINELGTYNVTYYVKDSSNKETTKTIKVTVKQPNYKESDNIYYFDSLVVNNGKLHLKGFLTITNTNNTLSNDIRYKLVFTNELNGNEAYQTLNRITDKNNIPFDVESENGFDYTYSWFEGDIDISKLPIGNYTLSLEAHDNTFITSIPLSNVFGAKMVSTFKQDNKAVLIRNDFDSRTAPIQFFVRDNLIGEKTSKSNYNISNEYSTINFVNNNLVIKGVSHIIGGNYSKETDVKRTLVFENINSFEQYSYDIGSITTGDYVIELRVSDGFDKTKGWFETNIDISNLPVGTYTINIATSSNVSDFGELQDIFNRKIDKETIINNKKYSFSVNKDKRFRIELDVKNI